MVEGKPSNEYRELKRLIMKKKILVTGASGFLGSRVVTTLLEQEDVQVFAGFHTSALGNAIPKACHVRFENTTIKETLQGLQPLDVIIHLGAISSPGKCEADPGLAFATNDASVLVDCIIDVAQETLVIFASTDLVYTGTAGGESGERAYHPCNDSLVKPGNVYAKTKAAGEQNIKRLKHGIVLRLSNMIGKGSGKFFDFISGAIKERKKIGLRHDEYRSFVAVDDVVRLILRIVQAETPVSGTYNVGGPSALSRLELAQTLAAAMGVNIAVADSKGECAQEGDESTWHVHKQSNAAAIENSGIFNPADVSMDSSATEVALLGRAFKSMEATFRDIL